MPNAPGIQQAEYVGRKIRKLRKQHKLTQTELSSRIGVHQSDLSRMEKGEYRVSLDTLFRVLAEFELSMGEFFDEINQEAVPQRDARLLRHLRSLNDEAQQEVEQFIAFKRSQNGTPEPEGSA